MNCEQQEWIDSYLFGELEGEERLRFEAKFASDEVFRAEVELQAEIVVGINSYSAALPEVSTPKPAPKLVWIKRHWAKAAAIIIFLIVANTTFQSDIIQLTENNKTDKHNNFTENKPATFYSNSTVVEMEDVFSASGVPVLASNTSTKNADSERINSQSSRGHVTHM